MSRSLVIDEAAPIGVLFGPVLVKGVSLFDLLQAEQIITALGVPLDDLIQGRCDDEPHCPERRQLGFDLVEQLRVDLALPAQQRAVEQLTQVPTIQDMVARRHVVERVQVCLLGASLERSPVVVLETLPLEAPRVGGLAGQVWAFQDNDQCNLPAAWSRNSFSVTPRASSTRVTVTRSRLA